MDTITDLQELFGFYSVRLQFVQLAASFLFGCMLIAVSTLYSYIVSKLFKKEIKRRIVMFFLDIEFWIAASFVSFALYYTIDYADIRPFCYIWIFCGMIAAYNIKLSILGKRKQSTSDKGKN